MLENQDLEPRILGIMVPGGWGSTPLASTIQWLNPAISTA